MKNILFFIVLVIVAITGTSIVLIQNTLASSTHITLHNLTNETAELWAEIPVDPPHCDAEPNLTCEAGTEYIWYTIQVAIPNSESPTWEQQLSGVFGECDVYITGSDGKYDAQHHCALAEKLDLRPSADNKTK